MTLLEHMDRLVYTTRLDRLLFRRMEPRSLRWTPLFVLVALLVGYVLTTPARPVMPDILLGSMLFYGAVVAAVFVRICGPRFAPSASHPLDEREMMVKARAHALSGMAVAGFAMCGCFYLSVAAIVGLWHPRSSFDWINLGFGIQAASMLLPSWIASWLQPPPRDDKDD